MSEIMRFITGRQRRGSSNSSNNNFSDDRLSSSSSHRYGEAGDHHSASNFAPHNDTETELVQSIPRLVWPPDPPSFLTGGGSAVEKNTPAINSVVSSLRRALPADSSGNARIRGVGDVATTVVDETCSISTILSEIQESEDHSRVRRFTARLEKQLRRRILQRGLQFNMAIAGPRSSGKSTLCGEMFERWHLRLRKHTTFGVQSVYQISEESSFVKVFATESEDLDFLHTYCELKLREFRYRKRGGYCGTDERIHLCLFLLDPRTTALSSEVERHIVALSKVVNLVPVICKCDVVPPRELLQRRACLQKQLRRRGLNHLFDDLVCTASVDTAPHNRDPTNTLHMWPSNDLTHQDLLAEPVLALDWGVILSLPLMVDCSLDFSAKDERYQLSRVYGFPQTSAEFLRTLLIDDLAFVFIDRTKALHYMRHYDKLGIVVPYNNDYYCRAADRVFFGDCVSAGESL